MGWKASTIIVNSDKEVDQLRLLNDLGFENLKEIEQEPFEVAINPDKGKVYIGKFQGNLLICAPDLPLTFFEESISKGELVLSTYFPNTEICSIILQSAVNLWGYSVSINKQKVRVRAGSSEDGIIVDFGEPLEQEMDIFSKSELDVNGKRVFLFDDSLEEPFGDDQVGENFVFDLTSRYFGQNFDTIDDLFFETELKGYTYNPSVAVQKEIEVIEDKQNQSMKYLVIIAIIIIWQIVKRTFFND